MNEEKDNYKGLYFEEDNNVMNMEHISNIKIYIINYLKLQKKEIKKKIIQIKKKKIKQIIMF